MPRHPISILAATVAIAAPATGSGRMIERVATEHVATGTFDVKLTPASAPDAVVARMTIAKTFHGTLDAVGTGEMMSMGDPRAGSAGYVAMERVTGTLDGRQGSFALQHSGTMDRGTQALTVAVVPGSGTGALAGLAGTMTIEIAGGVHRYTLRYSLPA